MIIKYFLHNIVDSIQIKKLHYNEFTLFKNELRSISNKYNLSIYLVGSYLNYLNNHNKIYNDINFIIPSQKFIELDDLYIFLFEFHLLCKKYQMNYELKYLVNVKADELNFNIKEYRVLPQKPIQCIRLYKDKNNIEEGYKLIFNNKLYFGAFNDKVDIDKIIKQEQKNLMFKKALKII